MFKFAAIACTKHCNALSYLDFRTRGIFHIHFPNVIALAKEEEEEEETLFSLHCFSALFCRNLNLYLPQPKCTVLKLSHIVRVYSKVVAHKGEVCSLH